MATWMGRTDGGVRDGAGGQVPVIDGVVWGGRERGSQGTDGPTDGLRMSQQEEVLLLFF